MQENDLFTIELCAIGLSLTNRISDVCVRFDGENEILIKKIIFLNEHSALATKDSTQMYT